MNEQRQILQMLAEDKITAGEAERLISAVERDRPGSPPGTAPAPNSRPKYLRVMVTWSNPSGIDEPVDGPGEGSSRINVRVPLQLLRAGVRLTSLVPPQALTRANAELDKAGVPIDLTELKPEHIEDLIEGLDDVVIDLEDTDATVHVFCE